MLVAAGVLLAISAAVAVRVAWTSAIELRAMVPVALALGSERVEVLGGVVL